MDSEKLHSYCSIEDVVESKLGRFLSGKRQDTNEVTDGKYNKLFESPHVPDLVSAGWYTSGAQSVFLYCAGTSGLLGILQSIPACTDPCNSGGRSGLLPRKMDFSLGVDAAPNVTDKHPRSLRT
jgi:hypothetical protein